MTQRPTEVPSLTRIMHMLDRAHGFVTTGMVAPPGDFNALVRDLHCLRADLRPFAQAEERQQAESLRLQGLYKELASYMNLPGPVPETLDGLKDVLSAVIRELGSTLPDTPDSMIRLEQAALGVLLRFVAARGTRQVVIDFQQIGRSRTGTVVSPTFLFVKVFREGRPPTLLQPLPGRRIGFVLGLEPYKFGDSPRELVRTVVLES